MVVYTIFIFFYLRGKTHESWIEVFIGTVGHVSTFIPVAIAIVLAYEVLGVYIMLLWDFVKKREIQQAKREVEEAKAEVNSWEAWNARRVEAERRNGKFDEPPPSQSKNKDLQ